MSEFLDTAQVASLLGVRPETVSRYLRRQSEGFPAPDIRLGRSPGWRRQTIEAWARSRPGRGARRDLSV